MLTETQYASTQIHLSEYKQHKLFFFPHSIKIKGTSDQEEDIKQQNKHIHTHTGKKNILLFKMVVNNA